MSRRYALIFDEDKNDQLPLNSRERRRDRVLIDEEDMTPWSSLKPQQRLRPRTIRAAEEYSNDQQNQETKK